MSITKMQNSDEHGPRSDLFVKADPANAQPVAEGIKRQILGFGHTIMGVRVWFKKGAVGEVHSHFHAQMAYVESGRFEVLVDGNKEILTAGDCFYVPPHAAHGAVCLEDGVLIDVFSPAREDFLPATEAAE